MNGYGTIDRMYRPLGIGVIRPGDPGRPLIIFTKEAVQGGIDRYQSISEGDEVEYKAFDDVIEDKFGFARNVRPKS